MSSVSYKSLRANSSELIRIAEGITRKRWLLKRNKPQLFEEKRRGSNNAKWFGLKTEVEKNKSTEKG